MRHRIEHSLFRERIMMNLGKRGLVWALGLALAFHIGVSQGQAGQITYTGSDASGRAASVNFNTSGSNLIVTLTNTSTSDVTDPTFILTGVLFNITGNPVLSAAAATGNAVIAAGSSGYIDTAAQPSTDIGSEWAYKSGLNFQGQAMGLGASGFSPANLFGSGNILGGPAVVPEGTAGTAPDGLGFGITSAGDNLSTSNGGISGRFIVKNSVVFTLKGLPAGFDPATSVTSARFLYGTASDDPQVPGTVTPPGPPAVPEPSTIAGAGLAALVGLLYARKRRRA